MIEQLRFYIRHSLNDLRTNRRLTFFALLSIAAGVAAIVSLQTLVVMIGDTLETNLQETNRGDVNAIVQFLDPDDEAEAQILAQTVEERGILTEETVSLFGTESAEYLLNETGLAEIDTWLAQNYPDARFTYRQQVAGEFQIITGIGVGTAITDPDTGDQATQLSPIVIDPTAYPYYSDIQTQTGELLGDVLLRPTDIVVSENAARNLDLSAGDVVTVSGTGERFIVQGVVALEEEVKNPAQDIFSGLFGFYYIRHDALPLFEDLPIETRQLYFQLDDTTPERVAEFNDALIAEFPFFNTTTTIDLRDDNEDLVEQLEQLMTTMGMVSVLLGSIGIVNTMQVIVRRRMIEIAILKTIGLEGQQITWLFLTQALIMGIIGGILGILLGWGATFAIKGVAEAVFATTIPFRLALSPALNGFFVGVVVATVFGFLPTLAAGQVRPGIVIRPQDNLIPRAGRLQTLFALLVIIVALGGVLTTITTYSFGLSVGIVIGTLLAGAVIYGLLWVLIWVVGRLLLLIGLVDIKVSMRQMLATRRRGASTLLALAVGVFSLSLITLFAESINNVLQDVFAESGGNTLISVQGYNRLNAVTDILDTTEGVNDYSVQLSYNAALVSFEESDTGAVISAEELDAYLLEKDINFPPFFDGTEEEKIEIQREILNGILLDTQISAQDVNAETSGTMASGRDLSADDAGQPVIVLQDAPLVQDLGISVGDKLTYEFSSGGFDLNLFNRDDAPQVTFEVIGINSPGISFNFGGALYAPADVFPESVDPAGISILADVDDDSGGRLRQALSAVPGTFAIDTGIFTQLLESLIGTFAAFPTLVAALGLMVGGVVIANSVALTTMERRKEIAVMKSVGLDRERVLGMLLLESAILGLIGGLFGVGLGLAGVVGFASSGGVLSFDSIPLATAGALLALCVGIAVLAALSSAWAASGEKPLTVLRYD